MSVELFEKPQSSIRRPRELRKRLVVPARQPRSFDEVWNDMVAAISLIALVGLTVFMVLTS